ncbi:MAG: B12-binding domain-containing radical SAM protein [Thermoplasmatales archaeon]|nr:B12-binding domain-containing radical SAM protein [Thermoplasmatales archaeon]
MKILLLQPPIDSRKVIGPFSHAPPLGLLYIARILEEQGHTVKILDFAIESFTEEKILKVIPSTDAVGMTITAFCVESAAMITQIIKREDQHIPVIIGGPMCCIQPRQTLIDTNADVCVEGEGEKIIGRIADALVGKGSLSYIPGLYYKDAGTIKKGPPSELIKDLDSILFPSRHLVDNYNYGHIERIPHSWFKGKLTSLLTSRGCPFRCKFCCVPNVLKKYRYRSVENVIEEMEHIRGMYDTIYIRDDNFLVNKKRAVAILDEIIKRDYQFEFWIPGIRASLADKTVFKKMKKAGVKIIQIGIESGNQDVLDFYNKKTTFDEIKNTVTMARKMGFFTGGNFILGAPFETKQHFKNTFEFATQLPLDIAFFFPLMYYKGSELWSMANQEGKIKENEYAVKASSSHGLNSFSQQELDKWCVWMTFRFYVRPTYLIDQLIQSFIYKDWRLYKIGFNTMLEWLATNKN